MFFKSKIVVLLLLISIFTMPLFSQESDWYYDQTISKIDFTGLESLRMSDIDGVLSQFIGEKFTDELYGEILNTIYSLEYFDEIEPSVSRFNDNQNHVLLTFKVSERPPIASIEYDGNKGVRDSTLRNTVTIKKGDIFNETKLRLDERAIRDHYLKEGFTNVRVIARSEEGEEGVDISFFIDEGAATVIKAINFEGNALVSAKTLKDTMTLKEASFFRKGAFQEATLELDKQEVVNYYHNRGYIDAELRDVVRTSQLNEEEQENELTLTFIVNEGIQYTYAGVEFIGNQIFTIEQFNERIRLDEGDVFNMARFQEGMAAITDLYAESGYTSNQYNVVDEKNPDTKQISFIVSITERPRSHIENIIIQGNEKTKDHVVLREVQLESGDIYSKTKLVDGLRNLYNLQYFSSVVPDVVPASEENLVNLIISLEEQSTTSIEFGVTFSGVSDPNVFPVAIFTKWQDSNVFGTGRSVFADLTLSPDQQSVGLGYTDNWVFGLPVTFGVDLEFTHANYLTLQNVYVPGFINSDDFYMEYTQWDIALSTYVGRRWFPNFAIVSLSGGLRFELLRNDYDDNVYSPYDMDLADYANRWGLINSVWTAVSLDDRDINFDPTKGWFLSERLSWTGLLPSIENDFFLQSDTKVEGYVPLLNIPVTDTWNFRVVLAGYTSLSFILPAQDSPVGYDNQLYIDGLFTGRGWDTLYDRPSARGLSRWYSYAELRFPVFPNIFGVDFFFDAVATKPTLEEMFTSLTMNDMYFSFGPGIRFSIPQFPLRLLLANTFQVIDGDVRWGQYGTGSGPDWQFVLSFNITNR